MKGNRAKEVILLFVFTMLIVFIIIIIFLIIYSREIRSHIFLLMMGASYLMVTLAFITYLSKDNYYFNTIYRYFSLNEKLHNFLILMPVSHDTVIRILNIFSMFFILFSLYFSLFFSGIIHRRKTFWIIGAAAIFPLMEILLYDPLIYKNMYFFLFPNFFSVSFINRAYKIIHLFTSVFNAAYLLTGIVLTGKTMLHSSKIKQIRIYTLIIFIGYTSIVASYLYIYYWVPDLMISVSKVADCVSYKPLTLEGIPVMYQLLPYVTLVCLFVNAYGIYKYTIIQRKIRDQDLEILQRIDSASLTVRVFCHYMKNELLAITSQTEYIESIIDENPKLSEEVKVIEKRCRDIYERLNDLHHNAVITKLSLKPLKIFQLIDKILSEMQEDLKSIEIVKIYQPPEPVILADQYYFSQAIQNIIINAAEAMEKMPPGNRRLEITVGMQNRWVVLSIKDNGPGIAEKDISNIFKPFFSSKPSSVSWGMGLSLCQNIILAHNGKITVDSAPGKGATFYIVLPRI